MIIEFYATPLPNDRRDRLGVLGKMASETAAALAL